jgi:hypothetical protein
MPYLSYLPATGAGYVSSSGQSVFFMQTNYLFDGTFNRRDGKLLVLAMNGYHSEMG